MDNFSITQYGEPLDKSEYTIDIVNKVFGSNRDDLVLDFNGCRHSSWTFKTGQNCTFKTGYGCTFHTGSRCTFITDNECTFDTGGKCTFNTGNSCTFKTGSHCTFDTGSECIFSLYDINTQKFKSYDGNSIILDRNDNKHYLLTKEFVQLRKISNG